jgi:hypothetical protein
MEVAIDEDRGCKQGSLFDFEERGRTVEHEIFPPA